MSYRIKITADAERDVRQLPGHVRQWARRMIDALADEPRPPGAKELRGYPAYYRIRLDKWRLIYHVFDSDRVVLVLHLRRKTGPETYLDLD